MEKKSGEVDWRWIDYMEGDIDPSLKTDLTLLLEHSKEQQDILTDLRAVRTIIEASDSELYLNEERLTCLQDKIMSEIGRTDIEELPTSGQYSKFILGPLYLTTGLMTVAVVFSMIFYHNSSNGPQEGGNVNRQGLAHTQSWLVEDSAVLGDTLFDSMIEYRDHDDIAQQQVIDVLDNVTDAEAARILDGLGTK